MNVLAVIGSHYRVLRRARRWFSSSSFSVDSANTSESGGVNEDLAKRRRKEAAYYQAHRDERLQYKKQYYLQNKAKIAERQREYQNAKKQELARKKREYYEANKQQIAEYGYKYYASNQEKLVDYHKAYYRRNKEKKAEYNREKYSVVEKERILRRRKELKEEVKREIEKDRAGIQEKFEKLLNIQQPSDWYSVTAKKVVAVDPQGENLLEALTLPEFLEVLYPSENWIFGKFMNAPRSTWKDREKTRQFLQYIQEELHIKTPEDWYRVSRVQLKKLGAGGCITTFGRLYNALEFAFPEVAWDSNKFSLKSKKSVQRWLSAQVMSLFPQHSSEIMESYLHPDINWEGAKNIELDVWIPSARLAFEYQGEQHYHNLADAFGLTNKLSIYSSRDSTKKQKCAKEGITLVAIPYWWDEDSSSLREIILEQRPKH